jgi:hypothetical protein
MMFIIRAFTRHRPFWFRPSAIAVGWIIAQFVYQIMTTGGLSDGICTDGTIAWRCP